MDKPSQIRNLVFSGGAAKGFAHLGALTVLDSVFKLYSIDMMSHIQGFGGASFGALLALACSLNLDLAMLQEWFMAVDTKTIFAHIDLLNFPRSKGLVTNAVFEGILDDLIRERVGKSALQSGQVTFEYLYRRTKKHLRIVASNIDSSALEVWDYKTHPTMSVKQAVMASCALPCIFEPVSENGACYLDGGLYCNYPIHIFPADTVLGLRLTTATRIDVPNSGIVQYVMHVFSTIAAYHEARYLESMDPEYTRRTININVDLPITSLDLLDPAPAIKALLVNLGEKSAMNYFVESPGIMHLVQLIQAYSAGAKAVKPADAKAFQPADAKAFQPADAKAFQPADAKAIKPADAKAFQPADASSSSDIIGEGSSEKETTQ